MVSRANRNEVARFHHIAMEHCSEGFMARWHVDELEARRHFQLAYEYEVKALEAMTETVQPTHSVLCRSAATLALDCDDIEGAIRLAKIGLNHAPPAEIRAELNEVMAKAMGKAAGMESTEHIGEEHAADKGARGHEPKGTEEPKSESVKENLTCDHCGKEVDKVTAGAEIEIKIGDKVCPACVTEELAEAARRYAEHTRSLNAGKAEQTRAQKRIKSANKGISQAIQDIMRLTKGTKYTGKEDTGDPPPCGESSG